MILLLIDLMQFSILVYVQALARLTIIFIKQVVKKAPCVFVVSTARQLSIFFLNVHFILPLELICSPLLLAYLLTGGFPCLKHKQYQFFCLDHSYFLQSKIMIYFLMSSLLYLNRRDFIKVPRCVFSTCQHCFMLLFVNFAAALTNYYLMLIFQVNVISK